MGFFILTSLKIILKQTEVSRKQNNSSHIFKMSNNKSSNNIRKQFRFAKLTPMVTRSRVIQIRDEANTVAANTLSHQPVVRITRESLESAAEKHGCTIFKVKPALAGYRIPKLRTVAELLNTSAQDEVIPLTVATTSVATDISTSEANTTTALTNMSSTVEVGQYIDVYAPQPIDSLIKIKPTYMPLPFDSPMQIEVDQLFPFSPFPAFDGLFTQEKLDLLLLNTAYIILV